MFSLYPFFYEIALFCNFLKNWKIQGVCIEMFVKQMYFEMYRSLEEQVSIL